LKIEEPERWHDWVLQSRVAGDCSRFIAHPGGKPLSDFDLTRTVSSILAVGPEGGLTDAEVAAAIGAGWQPVDLGPRLLRVETAAVALAAAIALGSSSPSSERHKAM
jgi:16S rRNA (uracil1498-N3)-methyltransferase